jgi:hypothetical protein
VLPVCCHDTRPAQTSGLLQLAHSVKDGIGKEISRRAADAAKDAPPVNLQQEISWPLTLRLLYTEEHSALRHHTTKTKKVAYMATVVGAAPVINCLVLYHFDDDGTKGPDCVTPVPDEFQYLLKGGDAKAGGLVGVVLFAPLAGAWHAA